jgi:hypothetical protein
MAALHSAIRMAPFPDWVFPEKAKMFAYWLGGTDRPEVLHERILEVAGTQEEHGDQDRRDGHVEAVLDVYEGEVARPPGGGSLRQVQRDAAPGGGPQQGSLIRIPPALKEGQRVRQGAVV